VRGIRWLCLQRWCGGTSVENGQAMGSVGRAPVVGFVEGIAAGVGCQSLGGRRFESMRKRSAMPRRRWFLGSRRRQAASTGTGFCRRCRAGGSDRRDIGSMRNELVLSAARRSETSGTSMHLTQGRQR